MENLKMTDRCDHCKKAVVDWPVIERDETGVLRCYRGDIEIDPQGRYCSLQCALASAGCPESILSQIGQVNVKPFNTNDT